MTSISAGKGARTRARLLEAAVHRFGTAGYRATSVASITRDVGLTPAAAFAYWPSKEALFSAAVDADARAVIHRLLDELERDVEHKQPIAPVPLLYETLGEHPLARRVLAGREPEMIDRLLTLDAFQELRFHLAANYRRAQEQGWMRADLDPDLAAVGTETMTMALVMALLQMRDPHLGGERLDGVEEVLRAAFRPPRR